MTALVRTLGRPWAYASSLVGLVLLVWAGFAIWSPIHIQAQTGLDRASQPGVFCTHCHRSISEIPVSGQVTGPRYVSPEGTAVSPDGKTLLVAGEKGNMVLRVDLGSRAVVRRVDIPGRPHEIEYSPDGDLAFVSSRDEDKVFVLDAKTLEIQNAITSRTEPLGLAVSSDGRRLFVANGVSDEVVLASVDGAEDSTRLRTGKEPYAVALSRDGSLLAVLSRRSQVGSLRSLPFTEVTLIDARRGRVRARRRLISAHLGEGVALSSDGSFALATILRIRNLLPTVQVARGAVMNSAIAFVETRKGGRTVQFPLSEANRFFADPSGIAITPDDRIAFVAHGGAHLITAVDLRVLREMVETEREQRLQEIADDLSISARYVLARIPTLNTPRKLTLSPDGRRLYVSEHLADSIAVIDTKQFKVVERIDLGGPPELTEERRGNRTFYDASGTFQGQFSCRSCHPDGHTDGLIWDFEIDGCGEELLETRPLRGITDTAPFKWTGKNKSIAAQCGARFARVLTRADPFEGEKLANLVKFIESIPIPPKRVAEDLHESIERGKGLFFRSRDNTRRAIPLRNRCATCHARPLYTNRLKADVGTGKEFDTPHLIDLASGAPYLHDGRARTLEEIWTIHDRVDAHGVTSDMNKLMLNDLVNYLRSL
jgi:YVTN family beta-propeller protein